MNQKEVNELRRRFRPDKNAISRVYGCYVNSNHEIVSYLDTSLGLLPEEETEMYLTRLKRVLSGGLGRNLIDMIFSTQQVMDSDEHRLLSALRDSKLADAEIRDEFYRKVIDNLETGDDGYLILLACDCYDIPHRGKDGENQMDNSDNVFIYIICAICPVKDSGMALRYFTDQNEFHSGSAGLTVGNTALGFLFPAFDNRSANIYNALYYAAKPAEIHQELIDALFKTDAPLLSPAEQREAFHNVLSQSLDEICDYDLLQTVHEQLRERIEEHKEIQDPEPLGMTSGELKEILKSGGVSQERLEAFTRACDDHFGENAVLNPANLIDSKRFEIITPDARILADPASSYMIETRVIDGRNYFLIPAEHDITINGMPIHAGEIVTARTSDLEIDINNINQDTTPDINNQDITPDINPDHPDNE